MLTNFLPAGLPELLTNESALGISKKGIGVGKAGILYSVCLSVLKEILA